MGASLVDSGTATFSDGNAGHSYSFPAGAPSTGQLDVLCVNSDTSVSTPSTGGAAWTLGTSHAGSQGAYLWYRIATGGEGTSTTITTSGNAATQVAYTRWGNVTAADVNAVAFIEIPGTTTPSVNTGTLSAAGELSVAFAALHSMAAGNVTSPSWSTGYTQLLADQSGTTATDVAAFVAYNLNAGTAAETPNVSWTTNATDRYILVQTFTAAGTGANAGNAAGSGTVTAAASTVRIGMTIRGS
jgi:hypothetical protein